MKKILTLLALIASMALPSRAQTYANEQLITMCDYVLNTPYDTKSPSFTQVQIAKAILLDWATNADEIIELGPWILDMLKGLDQDQNAAMMHAYFVAEIRYLLQHDQKQSSLDSVRASMRAALEYYHNADGRIKRTKLLKRLSDMDEQQFNDYVTQLYRHYTKSSD